ncbi:MAG: hypothetical protein JXR91_11345 [Deltaproteobacteria bacterium]|nr:hypothetical protein [Deltaproteobacteria bacterium]
MIDKKIELNPNATIHMVGICGTGMGALAGLLKMKGYNVTGSDATPYPPMSTALEDVGISVIEGYSSENINHNPDLVIIGNVCTATHVEARAAKEKGLNCVSMPHALHDLFIEDLKSLVIAGTHGKTTTTALTAYLLESCGADPSVLVGGITANFGSGFKFGKGEHFVIEGDEYDSAYFEKVPKFLSYAPFGAVITSVEYDHVDIYPDEDSYFSAFNSFAELVKEGPLALYSGDKGVRRVMEEAHITGRIITYGVKGDEFEYEPAWLAVQKTNGTFKLYVEGLLAGTFKSPLIGRHNLRNTLAALIMAHKGAGIPLDKLKDALPEFGGVVKRQQLLGIHSGITVYDDFAHHPTAVQSTIEALLQKHPSNRLIVAFEPRSATACRKIHQNQYADSFKGSYAAIIAPPGRELPKEESIDTELLATSLQGKGIKSFAARDLEEVLTAVKEIAAPDDIVAFFSNGSFGSVPQKYLKFIQK